MVRVIIAEDSTTTREWLVALLNGDPEMRVVGEAKNGREAVELTGQLRPDVVVMDIHMPVMDGFAATKQIMIDHPTPIVIVSASADVRDVEVAMHALRVGALTVLPKPPAVGAAWSGEATRDFVGTIKAMADVKVVRHRPVAPVLEPARPSAGPRSAARIVAVVASTGGPAALSRLLAELPGDLPVPILVVQHIAAGFVPGLAAWLATGSPLAVKVAVQGERLLPHTVYLAPDDRHLGVAEGGTALLSDVPPVGGFRPSGTFLFESVGKVYGPGAVAVVLTGMGQDGVAGLRRVREAGGCIVAQDEATAVVFGMPGAAIAAGYADLVVPLQALAFRLAELINRTEGGTI